MSLKLFWIFFKIGAFTLGGGYAMIPLIEKEIVEKQKMLTSQEYYDAVALSTSLPGAIAVNCSIFVGYKKRGIIGAFAAALGAILPAFLAIILVASVFDELSQLIPVQLAFKGIRPTIVVLITFSLIKMTKKTDFSGVKKIIAIAALILLVLDVSSFFIIMGAASIGFIFKRGKEGDSDAD
ncbi:MAG: chromate transporter [Proteocatella sp.]